MFRYTLVLIFAGLLTSSGSHAQDLKLLDLSVEQTHYLNERYCGSVTLDMEFVNGSLYQDYYGRTNGHQFFLNESWHDGSLVINGKSYEPVSIRYDILKYSILLGRRSFLTLFLKMDYFTSPSKISEPNRPIKCPHNLTKL